ncbi:methyltransferase domain-containing protein [Candidatus Hydrogenedentota bacterium]
MENKGAFADLVCVDCRAKLDETAEKLLSCAQCGSTYPMINGVPRFSAEDDFYEGKVIHTNHWRDPRGGISRLCASLDRALNISKIRERFFFEAFKGPGDILDVGCGGGTELLTHFGVVTGVDLSGLSCEKAAEVYSRAVQSDVVHMPFPEDRFDYVVGADLFGHISVENKDVVISEFRRILRPGGRLILVIECVGESPLWRFAKGRPDLWHTHFVLQDGHFGLETTQDALSRFENAGFLREVANRSHSDVWSVADYLARFKNDYRKGALPLRLWVHACKLIHKTRFTEHAADLLLGITARLTDSMRHINSTGALLVSFVNNK